MHDEKDAKKARLPENRFQFQAALLLNLKYENEEKVRIYGSSTHSDFSVANLTFLLTICINLNASAESAR